MKTQEDYLVRLGINTDDLSNNLPHIFLLPKFHKPQLSQRFVVSYYNCFIKPLAKVLTTGLKAIYFKICSYSNMMYKVTGIKRNWIIKNNEPLLHCLGMDGFSGGVQTPQGRVNTPPENVETPPEKLETPPEISLIFNSPNYSLNYFTTMKLF